jgi:hypothetical protein
LEGAARAGLYECPERLLADWGMDRKRFTMSRLKAITSDAKSL